MKTYSTSQIKNLVLVGNSGSGKTTLAETMLFEGGMIERRGEVEHKNTVSDFKEVEHNNTCSVFSSLLYTTYNDHKINLIDAPGLDDFINGMVAAMRVTDAALLVLNAQNGVEVGAVDYEEDADFRGALNQVGDTGYAVLHLGDQVVGGFFRAGNLPHQFNIIQNTVNVSGF